MTLRKISKKREERGERYTLKRSPIKKKPRTREEFARCYHSKERVLFVKGLNCVVCTEISAFFGAATMGHCHNAHTVNGGRGRKADYTTIVPLCASHHRRYDEHQAPCDDPVVREAIKGAATEVERLWLSHTGAAAELEK